MKISALSFDEQFCEMKININVKCENTLVGISIAALWEHNNIEYSCCNKR
jgi:hypothetical protein